MSFSSVGSGPLHVKHQVDLNIATEANRILNVLNKVISRVKFAGLIKSLIDNDGELLKNVFDEITLSEIVGTCQGYMLGNRFPSVITAQSIKTFEDTRTISTTTTSQDETTSTMETMSSAVTEPGVKEIVKILYTLEDTPEVQEVANSIKEISPQMEFLLKCLTEFMNMMEERLHESAEQYKTREKYLRKVYNKNERAKEEIERLEEELVVTKADANVCLIGKNILIKRHQNKIEKIKHESLDVIEKKVNESEQTMVSDWKNSMVQQERLKNDYYQASEKYSNLLKDHLTTEKTLRAKRTKLENQVLGWIQKYDQDIGEKQAEEEEIQALLDKESEAVKQIQRQLDEQGDEYDELMQEKADYEEEMLERRLYQFIVNRSARRIQKSYRMYKARKLARKLAKKGRKAKKKE